MFRHTHHPPTAYAPVVCYHIVASKTRRYGSDSVCDRFGAGDSQEK